MLLGAEPDPDSFDVIYDGEHLYRNGERLMTMGECLVSLVGRDGARCGPVDQFGMRVCSVPVGGD